MRRKDSIHGESLERKWLIRVAYHNPQFRDAILPLLKEAAEQPGRAKGKASLPYLVWAGDSWDRQGGAFKRLNPISGKRGLPRKWFLSPRALKGKLKKAKTDSQRDAIRERNRENILEINKLYGMWTRKNWIVDRSLKIRIIQGVLDRTEDVSIRKGGLTKRDRKTIQRGMDRLIAKDGRLVDDEQKKVKRKRERAEWATKRDDIKERKRRDQTKYKTERMEAGTWPGQEKPAKRKKKNIIQDKRRQKNLRWFGDQAWKNEQYFDKYNTPPDDHFEGAARNAITKILKRKSDRIVLEISEDSGVTAVDRKGALVALQRLWESKLRKSKPMDYNAQKRGVIEGWDDNNEDGIPIPYPPTETSERLRRKAKELAAELPPSYQKFILGLAETGYAEPDDYLLSEKKTEYIAWNGLVEAYSTTRNGYTETKGILANEMTFAIADQLRNGPKAKQVSKLFQGEKEGYWGEWRRARTVPLPDSIRVLNVIREAVLLEYDGESAWVPRDEIRIGSGGHLASKLHVTRSKRGKNWAFWGGIEDAAKIKAKEDSKIADWWT